MNKSNLLDAQKYATLTGLSYQTVLNYADAGVIPYQLVNRHCFFTTDSLALGLILNTKTSNTDNYLDFYFIGSDLPEEDVIEHSCFEHGDAVDLSDLYRAVTIEYEENLKVLNAGYTQEVLTSCKSKIEAKKQSDLDEFERKWKQKYPDGGDTYSYNLKRNRILDNYKICGNELGKKVEAILDEFLFDGIRKRVTQDTLGSKIKSGVFSSYKYNTTDASFDIGDFIEQIVRASRTKRYTEINVCIIGTVPEYVSAICKRLANMGVITSFVL